MNPTGNNPSFAQRVQQNQNPAQDAQRRAQQQRSAQGTDATQSIPGAHAAGGSRHPLQSQTTGQPPTHRQLRRVELRSSTLRNLEREFDYENRSRGTQTPAERTELEPAKVRMKTMTYMARGFKTEWDDNDVALRAQNEVLAREIMEYSAVPLPDEVGKHVMMRANLGNPIDDAPFIPEDDVAEGQEGKRHELIYEWNGGGWGGKGEAPLAQQATMREQQHQLGSQLVKKAADNGRMPLVIFGCSGGQPDPATGERKDNGTMAENIWVIDGIGEKMAQLVGRENEIALHFEPKSSVADHAELTDGKACGMTAYNEIIPYFSRSKEGQILMHDTPWPAGTTKEQKKLPRTDSPGRPVDCLLNERFVHYVIESVGPINGNLTWVGPMVGVGTDKAIGYAAFNMFIEQPGIKERFPTFSRRIPFAVVDDPDEMIEAIEAFGENQKESIIKPKGTGGGHGIERFGKEDWDDEDKMRTMIDEAFAVVKEKYLDRGVEAGWPFTVSEAVRGAKLEIPDDLPEQFQKYEGLEAEGRQGSTLMMEKDEHGFPTGRIANVVVQNTFKVKQAGSKVGNVTTQKEKLGMRNDELMLAGTNPHVMSILSYTKDKYMERARFLSEAMAFIYTKVAAQRTANPMVDTTTHPFGELPKLPYPD